MKDPAFLFYVRDWLSSSTVARMSGEQVKAYVYLLCSAWLEDETATLPADDESMAAAARVDIATWKRIKPLIMTKFESDGNGRYFNDRQYAELTRRKSKVAAALKREAARRAQNEHRTSTDHTTRLATATATATATPKGSKRSQRRVTK